MGSSVYACVLGEQGVLHQRRWQWFTSNLQSNKELSDLIQSDAGLGAESESLHVRNTPSQPRRPAGRTRGRLTRNWLVPYGPLSHSPEPAAT